MSAIIDNPTMVDRPTPTFPGGGVSVNVPGSFCGGEADDDRPAVATGWQSLRGPDGSVFTGRRSPGGHRKVRANYQAGQIIYSESMIFGC
jgi:hypothetical protein